MARWNGAGTEEGLKEKPGLPDLGDGRLPYYCRYATGELGRLSVATYREWSRPTINGRVQVSSGSGVSKVIEHYRLENHFRGLGWVPLLRLFGDYYPDLVREFYANMLHKMDKDLPTIISHVKGVRIVLGRDLTDGTRRKRSGFPPPKKIGCGTALLVDPIKKTTRSGIGASSSQPGENDDEAQTMRKTRPMPKTRFPWMHSKQRCGLPLSNSGSIKKSKECN
ncbi:hypothetical protein M9H77_23775 [Catharanthus roseus]|uniref:Uncharacterized protein n=1 Tax=Catharanthus roseus TaxID=4058 RepID=A0ACC0ATW2_CATRO|nr:hypothetical protein M9H77_23775 [Catharanthus roseus]